MRISIVGWYGQRNVGDDTFHCVFRDFFSGHDIEFVTPPQRCASNADIVVLGGGAVASPFYLDTLPDLPRYALGIDLAYESEAELLSKANFSAVFVRNAKDAEALQKKLSCPVQAIPDLAFYLRPTGSDILRCYKQHPSLPTIGVLVTDYVNPAIDRPVEKFAERSFSFQIGLAKELDAIAKAGYEVLLIPCSTGGYGDDRRINLGLASFMEAKPTNILDALSPQEMIDLIGQLDATICMRFHAHIFSMIARTPFVSIEFTRKVQLLLQEHKIPTATAGRTVENGFDFSSLRANLQAALDRQPEPSEVNLPDVYRTRLSVVKKLIRRDWLGERS